MRYLSSLGHMPQDACRKMVSNREPFRFSASPRCTWFHVQHAQTADPLLSRRTPSMSTSIGCHSTTLSSRAHRYFPPATSTSQLCSSASSPTVYQRCRPPPLPPFEPLHPVHHPRPCPAPLGSKSASGHDNGRHARPTPSKRARGPPRAGQEIKRLTVQTFLAFPPLTPLNPPPPPLPFVLTSTKFVYFLSRVTTSRCTSFSIRT